MYTYKIYGIIIPQRVNFNCPEIPITINYPEAGVKGVAKISVVNSAILIIFESDLNYNGNLNTLKNYLSEVFSIICNSYAYTGSYNYRFDLERIECDALGININFGITGESNIQKSIEERQSEFIKIASKILENPKYLFLKDVLEDFRLGIELPKMTGQFCFRALEIIRRNLFSHIGVDELEPNKMDKKQWKAMGEKANIDTNEFEIFNEMRNNFAFENRHGEFPYISGKKRELYMNLTRKIINYFINN